MPGDRRRRHTLARQRCVQPPPIAEPRTARVVTANACENQLVPAPAATQIAVANKLHAVKALGSCGIQQLGQLSITLHQTEASLPATPQLAATLSPQEAHGRILMVAECDRSSDIDKHPAAASHVQPLVAPLVPCATAVGDLGPPVRRHRRERYPSSVQPYSLHRRVHDSAQVWCALVCWTLRWAHDSCTIRRQRRRTLQIHHVYRLWPGKLVVLCVRIVQACGVRAPVAVCPLQRSLPSRHQLGVHIRPPCAHAHRSIERGHCARAVGHRACGQLGCARHRAVVCACVRPRGAIASRVDRRPIVMSVALHMVWPHLHDR
eukprot:5389354-Prymnesium_polylepis.2